MQHHGEVLTAAALPPSLVDGAASSPLDQTLYGLFPGEGAGFVICMNHKHAHALHITHTHTHSCHVDGPLNTHRTATLSRPNSSHLHPHLQRGTGGHTHRVAASPPHRT